MTIVKGVVEMMRLPIVKGGHMRTIVEMTNLNSMQGIVMRSPVRFVMDMK